MQTRQALYEGTAATGKGRVYYYHVNETGGPARVLVYAKSDKKQPITVNRRIKGDASSSYIPTGATLSFREAVGEKEKPETVTLLPGKKTILFDDDPHGIAEEDLVSGMVEIETKMPVTLGTAILPDGDMKDLEKALETALPLPPDTHEMRGTFARDIYLENENWDFAKGPADISIGNSYPFQKGQDEMSHVERENTGDYGITYHVTFHNSGSGKYNLYINAQGGVYMGTFRSAPTRGSFGYTAPMTAWDGAGLETALKETIFPAAPGTWGRTFTSASFPPVPPICLSVSSWCRKRNPWTSKTNFFVNPMYDFNKGDLK